MLGIAEFNALFALKKRTLTPDGMGGETAAESTVAGYGSVPAYVQTLPTREVVIDGKIVLVTLKNVFCNVLASVVSPDYFLTIDSADYEIVDVGSGSPLRITVKGKV